MENKINVDKDVEKLEFSDIFNRTVKLYRFLRKLNTELGYGQQRSENIG